MKKLFLECKCSEESLGFEYFPKVESQYLGFGDELWVSLWSKGFGDNPKKRTLRDKIRTIYVILKKGTLNTDMILLDREKIEELKNWLLSL